MIDQADWTQWNDIHLRYHSQCNLLEKLPKHPDHHGPTNALSHRPLLYHCWTYELPIMMTNYFSSLIITSSLHFVARHLSFFHTRLFVSISRLYGGLRNSYAIGETTNSHKNVAGEHCDENAKLLTNSPTRGFSPAMTTNSYDSDVRYYYQWQMQIQPTLPPTLAMMNPNNHRRLNIRDGSSLISKTAFNQHLKHLLSLQTNYQHHDFPQEEDP